MGIAGPDSRCQERLRGQAGPDVRSQTNPGQDKHAEQAIHPNNVRRSINHRSAADPG